MTDGVRRGKFAEADKADEIMRTITRAVHQGPSSAGMFFGGIFIENVYRLDTEDCRMGGEQ